MAKDGTRRGGARTGAGRKKKALTDRIEEGKTAMVLNDLGDGADLTGSDCPPVKEYMEQAQKNGLDFSAKLVYQETFHWLNQRGCKNIVNPQLVEQYAMSVARWIQCEQAISEYGFLAKHPTTGVAIASPYVSMSQNYMKQVNQTWYQIYQIVKENCSTPFTGDFQNDLMEKLLSSRERK